MGGCTLINQEHGSLHPLDLGFRLTLGMLLDLGLEQMDVELKVSLWPSKAISKRGEAGLWNFSVHKNSLPSTGGDVLNWALDLACLLGWEHKCFANACFW